MRSDHHPLTPDEEFRLCTLHQYQILDSEGQEDFDAIVRQAAAAFNTPMSVISFVDRDRQWFKAKIGISASETPRSVSFCTEVVGAGEPMVVADARVDPRFASNPLVIGEPNIRFYAGAPLIAPNGARLGALCVIDCRPRRPGETDPSLLVRLSRRVIQKMEIERTLSGLVPPGLT